MAVFDLIEVRDFVADLYTRLDRHQGGEGTDCAALDDALRHHARLCREFTDKVRQWGQEVFAGRAEFVPEVEAAWREEGARLHSRALTMHRLGEEGAVACFSLEGQHLLTAALWDLLRLIDGWVSPSLSVSPSARQVHCPDPTTREEARRRIAELPGLPADWEPADPEQLWVYRMTRRS